MTQIADTEGDLAELDSQLEDVRMDIADEEDRLECLRQRTDGVARDVAELRPIAADVRGWEATRAAEAWNRKPRGTCERQVPRWQSR